MYYKLENQKPVLCKDVLEWADWMQNNDRHIGYDEIGEFAISTVFLGVDIGHTDEDPLLFELCSFCMGSITKAIYIKRFSTWAIAEREHRDLVDELLNV